MTDRHPAPPLSLLEGAALFLDFDGTLVELAESPDAIEVPDQLQTLLQRLSRRLEGRLAVVSGRSLADLDRHLEGVGIGLSGSHGIELRMPGGESVPVSAPARLGEAQQAVGRFSMGRQGLLVEEKPAGVALHYRQAPEEGPRVDAFMRDLGERMGLSVLRGHMVCELRPSGADKGKAVRAFMAEPPFAGARPVFVGDDVTDEDAFAAAAEMGGAGIFVGRPRATAASWRLENVSVVAVSLKTAVA